VLVTGGAGFVGSHIVDELVARGIEVVVLDALHPAAHAGPPGYLNPEATNVIGDVRDTGLVERHLRGVDAVCHQASIVGIERGPEDLAGYVVHNDVGTASLLTGMHRAGFRGQLVLGSSMVVYGEGRYRCERHGTVRPGPRTPERLEVGDFEVRCPVCHAPLKPVPIREDAPLEPRSVYAATKVHQEHLCFVYGRDSGIAVTALRYHNVYGPRMPRDTPYAGVASIFRSELEAGQPPRVFEDGHQLRDFVHVRDVARANVLALTSDEPVPGPLNVASGTPRTIGQMAAALASAFGPSAPDPVVVGGWRPGDVRHVVASPARAHGRLGFRAKIGFEEGIRELAIAPIRERVLSC
jgi:dTDP-L-rhamnose 4-epimerase